MRWRLPECPPSGRLVESARLVRVIDGDTIEVRIGGRRAVVRYLGINAPKRGQLFYAQAMGANRRLVSGDALHLVGDVSDVDRYGRLLRRVIAGQTFVNLALVREGYAQAMTVPPDVACAEAFRAAEAEARSAGRGLWGRLTSTPTVASPSTRNCHPAYPTICLLPPPDLDCGEIPHRNFPVDRRYGDPHRLDGDHDGMGCEQ
ncbi:thermonuclease family protein [Thermoflexus sp.]|uniref:thermonuclease family protein n=1 Tax=Thermoflexus sp. TaxID=1969742 RepID=UPI002ADE958C|nr:thermonuclease family protein [Thermoflexus sp.]